MKYNKRMVFGKHLALLLVLLFVPACQVIDPPKEEKIIVKEKYYFFNPDTILSSLASGRTDIFFPRLATPEPTLIAWRPIRWQQTDYYKIAQAVHLFSWNESLDTWKLSVIDFDVECMDVDNGPQSARFEIYQNVIQEGKEARIVHNILVEPEKGSIKIWETKYYPKLADWPVIDFSALMISLSNEALQIAEGNGGKEARSAVQNDCYITIILAPGAMYSGWQVIYSNKDLPDIISFRIDPISGYFKIFRSKVN